jgi:peptidoglycan/xylan/chitin deacetylase (PgdA/CDA1 family)
VRDRLALCYHAVSSTWPAALAVTPAQFEYQLEWLAAHGYRGVTFRELVSRPGPGRLLAVTFDDGFRSVMSRALPILERLRWPATIFVPTPFMDGAPMLRWPGIDHWYDSVHCNELAALSWGDLRELAAHGWEIGSHTLSHPRLSRLGEEALEEELRLSRIACEERLGMPCASVAYPYGDVDERVVAAAGSAGYQAGAALSNPRLAPRSLAYPRVGVYRVDRGPRFRAKVSRGARVMQRTPVWPLVKSAQRALTGR